MKGKCPKCGVSYYGWALGNPLYQKCEQCGNSLEISEGNAQKWVPVLKGYSDGTIFLEFCRH
jgi:hypothetical protein